MSISGAVERRAEAGRSVLTRLATAGPAALARAPEVIEAVRRGIAAHNRSHPGASMRIARVHLLAEPPSFDADEITEKGYIHRAAVLERRAIRVRELYADPPGPDVQAF